MNRASLSAVDPKQFVITILLNNEEVQDMCYRLMRCLLNATVVSLSIGALAMANAQEPSDFEPGSQHETQAPCNSKEMPRGGYDIARRLPDSNQCWWVKAANAQQTRSDFDPGVIADDWRPERPKDLTFGPDTTPQVAFGMAWSRHKTSIEYIKILRDRAEKQFWETFLGCGTDPACMSRAATELGSRRTDLGNRERRAEQQFDEDIRAVANYYIYRNKEPGNQTQN